MEFGSWNLGYGIRIQNSKFHILYSREMKFQHTPVLLEEVIKYLKPRNNGFYIDCTLGGAGYTKAISKVIGESGKILAIDLDQKAIANARKKNLSNVILVQENFGNLKKIVADNFPAGTLFNGIVMDLGLSSAQLDDRERGFSFLHKGPLDMSFDGRDIKNSTAYIVNNYKEEKLANIIKRYGEEKFAKRIAKKIIEERKKESINDSSRLGKIIAEAIPSFTRREGINPATKTFQALRIETNRELEALERVLPAALALLKKSGRLVVVSFHSLEDRIVKDFFKKESKDCLCPPELPVCACGHKASLKILTRKPIEASEKEVRENQRSRSAKLRAAEKVI